MRRRQILQQNNGVTDSSLGGASLKAQESAPRSPAPGLPSYAAVNKAKRGWPKGKPRKPGVGSVYAKGSPV